MTQATPREMTKIPLTDETLKSNPSDLPALYCKFIRIKNVLLLTILMLFFAAPSFSQEADEGKKEYSLKDHIFVGGSFGLSFGDVTFIDVSPLVGYRFNSRFSAGTGFIYQYLKYRDTDYSSNTFGGRVFGRAMVYNPVFAQVEYEYLNFGYRSFGEDMRADYSSLLAGGGISQPISNKVYLNMTALYNFTYALDVSEAKPYDSPWVIRVELTGGF